MKCSREEDIPMIYETDDYNHAIYMMSINVKGVSVEYHAPKRKINPLLVLNLGNGHYVSKWNPEYIEYLKRKYPGITDEKIAEKMNEAINEIKSQENENIVGKRR